ncbi:MAG: amidohydrolase [Parvularcula sp.]
MKLHTILATTVAAVSLFATSADAQDREALRQSIKTDYDQRLAALFKDFHTHPELSFRETRTAGKMAAALRSMGYDVTDHVGKTGVVAVLKNGAGPTVLIRADMDGLPIREDTGLAYISKVDQVDRDGVTKPVMHACGHDVHITSLLGTAKQLRDHKDEWSGTVVLIVQPAEEIISGARAMIEDGLYTRFPKPDYALAFHVSASMPTGKLGLIPGTTYSSSDSVNVTIRGVGAHGAAPHQGIDPVVVAAEFIVSLQTIISRTISPLEAGVITVGSIHGGIKHNIIPDHVDLQLTVRADTPEVRKTLLDSIDRVAKGTAIAMDVPDDLMPIVERLPQQTPPTKNDPDLVAELRGTMTDWFGSDIFYDKPRLGMGAEDFAYFVAPEHGVKGAYFAVGGTPEKDLDEAASHHSPFFKVAPEEAITLGTETMVVAAMELMPKK